MTDYEYGSMNWDADIETILKAFVNDYSAILEGTDYYVLRNSTIGEKCINLMKKNESHRVGHIWPKKRSQTVDVCLTKNLAQVISTKISLPQATEVKKDRLPEWCGFSKVSYEKTIEIINALANK